MRGSRAYSTGRWASALSTAILAIACGSGGGTGASTPPCDQTCKDDVAVRALRETMKLAFNVTLQGQPVGAHDVTAPCPLGGTARVFGTASSNASQGATVVDLSYVFDHCQYVQQDTDPTQNYHLTATGTVKEVGTIAVQPSSTTALGLKSDGMTLSGTVYDPPLDYQAQNCPVALQQDGAQLSGTMCGRNAGLTL